MYRRIQPWVRADVHEKLCRKLIYPGLLAKLEPAKPLKNGYQVFAPANQMPQSSPFQVKLTLFMPKWGPTYLSFLKCMMPKLLRFRQDTNWNIVVHSLSHQTRSRIKRCKGSAYSFSSSASQRSGRLSSSLRTSSSLVPSVESPYSSRACRTENLVHHCVQCTSHCAGVFCDLCLVFS